jgi:peptide methionine sulfoxide reductase msrA/msrB
MTHRGSSYKSRRVRYALLPVLALLLAACGSAAGPSNAKAPTGEDDIMPRYSKSGYDVTPWTDAQIAAARARLTPEQAKIAFAAATEAPFCGLFTDATEPGTYVSVVSGLPLFRSTAKFHSGSGWASFFEPFDPAHVLEREDRSQGMVRTEIRDARSGAHLGHVFDDGPPPTGKRYCLNSEALAFIPASQPLPPASRPVASQVAYFAGGCFWGVEDEFAKIPGVIDAVSGYMGGHTANPTYQDVCGDETGHAETVKVVFDPARVTYADLLKAFFTLHDPTTVDRQGPDVGTQYRSVIFAATPEQATEAKAYIERLQASGQYGKSRIVTKVETAPVFYEAEAYHQDYHAKHGGTCKI